MISKKRLIQLLSVSILLPVCGLIGLNMLSKRPENLGARAGKLAPCPDSPNCINSQADDKEHFLLPIKFSGDRKLAVDQLKSVMASRPRTKLVTETDNYLHFESTSLIFRFVDDIEFLIEEETGLIQFRSASRVGRSDLGVNQQRMEAIRQAIEEMNDELQ